MKFRKFSRDVAATNYKQENNIEMINFNTDPNVTYPLKSRNGVKAIYTRPEMPIDRDNMFIAALPKMLTEDEVSLYYYQKFPGTISKDAPVRIQKQEIALLDNILLPLDYADEAEEKFREILERSYRKRHMNGTIENAEIIIGNEKTSQGESMTCSIGKDGHTGMGLLGVGGTGKSSFISKMLERYPQVIIHDNEKGQTVQIVWLYVMPLSRRDLNGFMNSIAEEIDKAIMNNREVYSKEVRTKKTLGEKAKYIADLFRLFNVGALIIDEVQMFEVYKNQSDSYESLMTIIDKSKVAMFLCGTEEAFHKFFYRYYVVRRIGEPIGATDYCRNFDSFKDIFNTLAEVNWFKYPVYPDLPKAKLEEFKVEVMNAFQYETAGIIERIIHLWQNIQKEYVNLSDEEKRKFILTPEVIKKVSRKKDPFMSLFANETVKNDLLLSDDASNSIESNEIHYDDDKNSKAVVNAAIKRVNSKLSKSIEKCRNPILAQALFERVTEYMTTGGENYSNETIINEIIHTIGLNSSKDKTEDELLTKTIKALHKHPEKQEMLRTMQHSENAKQDLSAIK